MRKLVLGAAIATAAGSVFASAAAADTLLSFTFVPEGGTAEVWELTTDNEGIVMGDGFIAWTASSDITIGGATIRSQDQQTSLLIDTRGGRGVGGPSVQLNFGVQAGMANGTFTINSGFVNFAALPNASGRASATLTLTDFSGNNVVEFNGNTSNDLLGGYRANYNGTTRFAELFQGTTFGPGVGFTDDTGLGFLPIGDPVANISSQWGFSLSALDVAVGTSNFEVIPTPGTAALLALAGLTAANRRRRR